MLREGVEIIPSREVPGGVRVRVVGEDLEIDLTDGAVSKLLLKHLLPRYKSILEGFE
jgi:V/A-type H+-transporting ATPase subunit E